MKFEWDELKNITNIQKHGINFKDVVFVFSDHCALSIPDQFAEDEERWLLLGMNLKQQILLVVHTFRNNDIIRIISARKATQKEKTTYLLRAKQ